MTQGAHRVRFEQGLAGGRNIAYVSVVLVVVVDVLSFSTCVSVALDRGIEVIPARWRDERAAALAAEHGAVLAGPRSGGGISLSHTYSDGSNVNKSIADTLAVFGEIVPPAREAGLRVRAYVSTVWGCPYEGDVDPKVAVGIARKLVDLGCYQVSIAEDGRSALSLFKDLLADPESQTLRDRLKTLSDHLGDARNLDVYLQRAESVAEGEPAPDLAWMAKLKAEGVTFIGQPYAFGDRQAVLVSGPSHEAIEIIGK